MKKKKSNIDITPTLDLHGFRASSWFNFESDLFLILDKFITAQLFSNKSQSVKIIVGKGHNSTKKIQNKNPLRYYVENYLRQANLRFENILDSYLDQSGIIQVFKD